VAKGAEVFPSIVVPVGIMFTHGKESRFRDGLHRFQLLQESIDGWARGAFFGRKRFRVLFPLA
jgi:hypothetical protein